ncbi:MAG: hypothetical protein V1697_03420 [Candidatus Levyibacteriota bacterium]
MCSITYFKNKGKCDIIASALVKISSKKPSNKCFSCKSALILVKAWIETNGGGKFPQKISIYRCSNDTCQKAKDKEEEKRKLAVKDKEKRMRENVEKKAKLKKEKLQLARAKENSSKK